ncbi:MAG TPA: PIG-L family deacetylase, partial [Candidatus Binataceae bacterium]|nr:PIG-L family deacetylase [Candidatus Binataceae bacterium]
MAKVESADGYLEWFCRTSSDDCERFSVAVLAAHPDDEIIGAGVQLSKLERVTVIYITDGAPRNLNDAKTAGFESAEEYASARRSEAVAALALCDVVPPQILCLNVADQEASHNLRLISRSIAPLLDGNDIVLTHPYEGGHPDHDAAAFCARASVSLLQRARRRLPKAIIEFTSYHARGDGVELGRFRPNGRVVRTRHLTLEEQASKREMFARHATQRRILDSFPVFAESFRLAPHY